MTSVSTIMYIDKLDDVVNKYADTYITNKIKMNSINVKSGTYIDFNKENNMEDPKFEVDSHVRISKYKNIFADGYAPNWHEDVFVIKKKNKFVGTFFGKILDKTNQKEFRIEKVINGKGDRLHVKWKDCDNSFNSLIDQKDIVI